MKNTLLFSALTFMVVLTSCDNAVKIYPSDEISTKELALTSIEGVTATDNFSVQVILSDEEKVVVQSNTNLHEHIRLQKSGSQLYIELWRVNIQGSPTLNVQVYTSYADDFEATGNSSITVMDTLYANSVNVEASGDSRVTAIIESTNLTANASGNSKIQLSGTCDKVTSNLSGDSELGTFNLQAKYLYAHLSGNSEIELSVSDLIKTTATGDSEIHYKGHPVINSTLSGDSKVTSYN